MKTAPDLGCALCLAAVKQNGEALKYVPDERNRHEKRNL
jgi:hypothetical protein